VTGTAEQFDGPGVFDARYCSFVTGTRSGATATGELPLQWPLVGRHDQLDLFAATLADPRAHGFVIHGAAGVGKTRLADQCLAQALHAGRNVARATATEGSRSVPLGVLAHLLPREIADERCDLVAVMSEVRPVLLAQESNGPMVLFVDDLHLIDVTSATLLGQLVDAGLVFLVGTVRADEPVAADLAALWHRARVRRIDLDDLDRASIDTLLHLVLRGPVEASTITEISSASQCNVLFVRELVLGAIAGGNLLNQRGVWRLVGPLVTTIRLRELIAARLSAVTEPATKTLERLAVWDSIGLTALEELVGAEPLEELDRSGVLTMSPDQRRQHVTMAHPLYGEIIRDGMPALTRRRLLLERADRIDAYGARRREDPIRVATARLEASGSADPELLVRAARLARYGHDLHQVELLSRAALVHGMTPEVGLLLGEALHEVGTYVEADEVLTAAEQTAADDELLVHIVELRSRNLMWGMWRADEAVAVNRAALDRVSDASAVEELTLNEAMLLTYSGRPVEALETLARITEPTSQRTKALRSISEVPALIVTGRSETAVRHSIEAFAEQMQLPDQIAIPGPGVHIINQIWALAECGRLDEATALAAAAYDATPASAPPDGLMWLAHSQGRCALLSGRIETARRWLGEALARCEAHEIVGPSRLVLSALAAAHATAGDAAAAGAAVDELDRVPPFAFVRAEQELGRGWALVAAGDLVGARQVWRDAADDARRTGHAGTEAWLLHEIARVGEPSSVAARLSELTTICESNLINAYAAHAAAHAGGNSQQLLAAAEQFEAMGASLLAAEAYSEAAQALQNEGERRASVAAKVRASTLADRCEGATTPGLGGPVMVVPLTPRERDIATLAARGQSSKDIADRLFLSVRTVNNHLQSVYSKLGISGRRQLSSALADEDPIGQ